MLMKISLKLEKLKRSCDEVLAAYDLVRKELLGETPSKVNRKQLDDLWAKLNSAEYVYVEIEDTLDIVNETIDEYKDKPGYESYVDIGEFRGFFWKMISIGYRAILVDKEKGEQNE